MRNRKNYSNNWNDQVRPFILKRDNYQCKKCKVNHRSTGYYENKKIFVECDEHMKEWASRMNFKLITIYLQVHHKNGNTLDNAESNLNVICQRKKI